MNIIFELMLDLQTVYVNCIYAIDSDGGAESKKFWAVAGQSHIQWKIINYFQFFLKHACSSKISNYNFGNLSNWNFLNIFA